MKVVKDNFYVHKFQFNPLIGEKLWLSETAWDELMELGRCTSLTNYLVERNFRK